MARSGQGRIVAAINGAVSLTLVALLAVVALVVKPPSPPGISEFAPQATKPISKAPPGQAARHGAGPGACAEGQNCAPPPTLPPRPTALPTSTQNKGVPSALQCYEWPDGRVTQTFDPQSPPCIASWPEADKGNGGATTRGVTTSAVRVTMLRPTFPNAEKYLRGLVAFFNARYQFYGRHLVLVFNEGPAAYEPSQTHAAAQAALATDAFAAVNSPGDNSDFNHELAVNRMVSVTPGTGSGGYASGAALKRDAPYVWSYEPPFDEVERNLAAFVCTSLKGKPVKFAADYIGRPRTFVIANKMSEEGGPPTDPRPLREALKACGLSPDVVTISADDRDPTTAQKVAELSAARTTTVLNLEGCCDTNWETAAGRGGWHPEWVYYGADEQYEDTAKKFNDSSEDSNRLGLAPRSKVLPRTRAPWYQAAPVHPGYEPFYNTLQLLAAGVQMAGPNLTPQSFAKGLHDTEFPNPGAGAHPSYQAGVGFPGDEVWQQRDYAVWWPDTSKAPGPFGYELCFVDNGRRWSLGSWVDIEAKIKGGLRGC